ncbi:MFS transporter, partial [Bacillus cereus]|nr:MFS transporter [Bacillus cereus]
YMYAFSMAAYALLFLSTFFLQFEDKKSTTPSKQAAKDNSFMEVFRILKGIPIAFTALILSIIPLLFIAGFNLMVINISEMQHDPTIKGFIYTIEGVAFMLGAFVIKRLSDHFKPEKLLYFFAVCTAFAHLSLFFSDIKWMALTSFGLFGFSVGCFFPIMSTIFQTKVEKSYHGRLFSFRNMFERVMFQIVLLGTGFFLDTIGLQYMVLIFGVVSLLIISISLSKQKHYEKQHSQSANL